MVYRIISRHLLSDDDQRNFHICQNFLMLFSEKGTNQNNSINLFIMENGKILQLFLHIICGISQKQLIITRICHFHDTRHNSGDGTGINSRNNNTYKIGSAGTESLRLHRWMIARFLHNLSDCFTLFIGNVSFIKIS